MKFKMKEGRAGKGIDAHGTGVSRVAVATAFVMSAGSLLAPERLFAEAPPVETFIV